MDKIGLIAGNRRFPLLFAQAAKKRGCQIIAIGIKGDTSAQLKKYVNKLYWLRLGEFNRMLDIFKAEGITKIVMAGQISPRRLFSKEVLNSEVIKSLLEGIKDKRADSIFKAIARKLEEAGFELLPSTTFIEDYLPAKGVLTKRSPVSGELEDINFGFNLAKEIANLDIGQTIAVKNKTVVAVEALEGTDNLIRRLSRFTRGGLTLVKVSRPNQDMRFDIPVVGLNTIKNLSKVKASCLAIEAGKTLFLDKEKSVRLADNKGITIVAV